MLKGRISPDHYAPYLFLPPLLMAQINGMSCVQWPPASALFYWSLRPDGITEWFPEGQGWPPLTVPKLELEQWIGVSWRDSHYKAIHDFRILDADEPASENNSRAFVTGKPCVREFTLCSNH